MAIALLSTSSGQTSSDNTIKSECRCDARDVQDERQRKILSTTETFCPTRSATDKQNDNNTRPHKRSLWRKLLGKSLKSTCNPVPQDRETTRSLQRLELPSEFDGCIMRQVSEKRVPYTREMVRLQRLTYKPMDVILEEHDA